MEIIFKANLKRRDLEITKRVGVGPNPDPDPQL